MPDPSRPLHPLTADDQVLVWLGAVSRRADVIAAGRAGDRELDRRTWLRAEFEVFERLERARPWDAAWRPPLSAAVVPAGAREVGGNRPG